MTGLLGMFAKAPEKQSEIVFLEGKVQEVCWYPPAAHGVTGRVTYHKIGDEYFCDKTVVGGTTRKKVSSESLFSPLAKDVKEILDARTIAEVTAILERYHQKDQYKIIENQSGAN